MAIRTIARWVACAMLLLLAVPAIAAPLPVSPRDTADRIIAEARAAMLIDPLTAYDKARSAEPMIARIADPGVRGTMQATVLWLEGDARYRQRDLAAAAPLIGQALTLARRYAPGSKLEGDVLVSGGFVHGDTGEVVAALTEFQRAHTIFLKIGDARNRAIALVGIASLYNDANDFTTSLRYFDQALAAFDGDPGISVSIQNNRATVLRNLGRLAEAERGFRTAFALAGQMHSRVLEAQILRNIARTQLKRGDLAGADRTIERGRTLADQLDGDNAQAILSVAAQAALQRGRIATAAGLIERSLAGLDPNTTPLPFRETHETAYHVYRAEGRYDLAFVHLLALKRLDDQATRLATSSGAALMAARFDFANQELRIARFKAEDLERRVASERERAASQRYIFLGSLAATAIVIAALLTGLIVIRRSRDSVRAANADFALANVALGKALAAKTEFLATTSHEIRTPLNGILGMTQVMLADAALPATIRDRLSVVHGAGTTMRALVDDILDVAKMETGKLTLESAPFDLRATVLDATRLWEAQAASKRVAFVRTLDACPQMVLGDAARVRQVVFNLLSNALKFTADGEIGIAVTALDEADGGGVAIRIRDTGIGIPADKLEAIFESFRQADAGTTRQYGGTGLGLAICRQLARAMGGEVSVESVVGRGSVFTVTLPLAPVAVPATTAAVTEADRAPALLIVDRNPITRSLFATLMAPHAPRIVLAADAGQAIAAIRAGGIAHVLIDDATIRASDDVHAALHAIATVAAGQAHTVLLWPQTDEAAHAALLAAGVDRIAPRPIGGPSLVALLFGQPADQLVRQAA